MAERISPRPDASIKRVLRSSEDVSSPHTSRVRLSPEGVRNRMTGQATNLVEFPAPLDPQAEGSVLDVISDTSASAVPSHRRLTPPEVDDRMSGSMPDSGRRRLISRAHDEYKQYNDARPERKDSRVKSVAKTIWRKIGRRLLPAATAASFMGLAVLGGQPRGSEASQMAQSAPIAGSSDTGDRRADETSRVMNAEAVNQSVEQTWGPTLKTKEEMLQTQNRQNIKTFFNVKDSAGDMVRQLVAKFDNKRLFDTMYDSAAKQYQEYYPISNAEVPIGRIGAILAYNNGIIIASGEKQFMSGDTQVAYSLDNGKSWLEFNWQYGIQGTALNLVDLPSQNGTNGAIKRFAMVTAAPEKSTTNIYIGTIDNITKQLFFTPAEITMSNSIDNTKVSVQVEQLAVAAYDEKTNKAIFISDGNRSRRPGLLKIELDMSTTIGSAEPIVEQLGDIYAKKEFIDDNKELNILAVSDIAKKFFVIEGRNSQIILSQSFGDIFDNKNIPDYVKGSIRFRAIETYKTANGERKVVFAGSYQSLQRRAAPIVGSFTLGKDIRETLVFNAFMPEVHSQVDLQREIEFIHTPDNKPILVMKVSDLGMAVYDIESNKVLYTVNGLQRTNEVRPTSTVPSSPENKIFLPSTAKAKTQRRERMKKNMTSMAA